MTTWTVGKKIGWTGGTLVLLTIVLGVAALAGLSRIGGAERSLLNEALPGILACTKAEASILEIRGYILRHMMTHDVQEKAATDAKLTELREKLQTQIKQIDDGLFSSEGRELNRRFKDAVTVYLQNWDQVAVLSRALQNDEAFSRYMAKADLFYAARNAIQAEAEYNRRVCQDHGALATQTRQHITLATWAILVIATLTGIALVLLVVRSLNRTLSFAVNSLTEGASQVTSAAGQVASSSQAQAQGASEQAASLEESSAAAEEVRAMAQANADQSDRAAKLAHAMASQFTAVDGSLNELMSAMSGIGDASGQISKIIKVIDEIAFQTNLLALNAAVEAARAGEAGMGFAVVADEVRNLAQRSTQAAKDTTSLIEGSIDKSNNGRQKADRVAAEIRTIAEQVGQVKTIVEEINQSSVEQAKGISQVARGVAEMERVTQASAASSEEAAAAAEQLTAQSQSVRAVVHDLEVLVAGSSHL